MATRKAVALGWSGRMWSFPCPRGLRCGGGTRWREYEHEQSQHEAPTNRGPTITNHGGTSARGWRHRRASRAPIVELERERTTKDYSRHWMGTNEIGCTGRRHRSDRFLPVDAG